MLTEKKIKSAFFGSSCNQTVWQKGMFLYSRIFFPGHLFLLQKLQWDTWKFVLTYRSLRRDRMAQLQQKIFLKHHRLNFPHFKMMTSYITTIDNNWAFSSGSQIVSKQSTFTTLPKMLLYPSKKAYWRQKAGKRKGKLLFYKLRLIN